jgi:hypothetical protein
LYRDIETRHQLTSRKEDTIRDQDRRINAAISGLSTNLSEVAEGSAPSVDYRQTRSRQEPVMYQAADSLINYHKATYDHQHRPHIPGRLQDTKAARSDQFYSSLVNCQSTKSWAQKKVGAMRAELGTTGDASFLDGFYLKSEGGQEATSSSGEKNDAASKEIRAEVITTLGDLGFKDFGQAAWGNTLQYEYCRQHE